MTAKRQENGWVTCKTEEDWRKLQNLIEYHKTDEPPNVSERETLYKCPPAKQTLVKLLLINQDAIGFYIVRLKGLQEDGGLPFQMPILDGVFISKAYRRQGWGTAMIDNLVNVHFPGQYIGFSRPISLSLESVLNKFLAANQQHRSKLWAVENCGEEGDRLNLWLSLAKRDNKNNTPKLS